MCIGGVDDEADRPSLKQCKGFNVALYFIGDRFWHYVDVCALGGFNFQVGMGRVALCLLHKHFKQYIPQAHQPNKWPFCDFVCPLLGSV